MGWWKSQRDRDHAEVMAAIKNLTNLTMEGFKKMATKLEQLNASLNDLTDTVTEAVTEIEAQLKVVVTPGISDADADAAIARISGITASLKTEVANLKADNPPAG